MYTLQGTISKLATNANFQFEALGHISQNAANYQTIGYKAVRFEEYMDKNGVAKSTVRTDHSTGSSYFTDRKLDIAIDGTGFIPVTDKDGKLSYTRDGSLKVSKDGYLATQDDCIVGDGIKIPREYEDLDIKADGSLWIKATKESKFEKIGKIDLFSFNNLEGLESIEGNKFKQTDDSGEPMMLSSKDSIKQGFVEKSNMDVYDTTYSVMRLNSSLIASTTIMKALDDVYRQSINLRQ